jgi:hypothetical protein
VATFSRYPSETSAPIAPGGAADRMVQIEREQQERAARRQQEIAALSSPFSDPAERIRLWERLHALQLPASRTHRLLRVIAKQTDLTMVQLHEEQARRAAPRGPE